MVSQKLVRTFNFVVYIDKKQIPFSSVSGISARMETETMDEGGKNNIQYSTKKKGKNEKTLTLERALPIKFTEEQKLKAGQTIKNEVSVYLKDEFGHPCQAFHFTGCTVEQVALDTLDASKSGVLMQRVDIKYQNMEEEDLQANDGKKGAAHA